MVADKFDEAVEEEAVKMMIEISDEEW
jgi:hypothetical protein